MGLEAINLWRSENRAARSHNTVSRKGRFSRADIADDADAKSSDRDRASQAQNGDSEFTTVASAVTRSREVPIGPASSQSETPACGTPAAPLVNRTIDACSKAGLSRALVQ